MSKRHLATVLWFMSGWALGSMLTFMFQLPRGLDIALSVLAAGLIWWDPARMMWSRRRPVLKRPAEVVGTSTLATE